MTTINESLTAKGYTPNAQVPAAFGQPRNIEGIVIHHWGLPGQTHDGVVNFFVNGPGATSAHYVVSDGRIHCLVSDSDAAWHCPGKNATTIGIECRPEATDGDYATVAELIRTLRARYGNLPLSRHRDWYATACPGVWDLDRLDKLARAGTITPQSTEEDTLSAAEVAEIKKHATAQADRVIDYVGKVMVAGYSVGAQKFPGSTKVDIVNQQLLKTIIGLLQSDAGLSEAQITEAIRSALADSVVSVDVNVTGKE